MTRTRVYIIAENSSNQVVFEGPAHTTGKKPEPSRTEPQKTEPLYAVFSGLQPVATTVFTILTNKKNR